MGRRPILVLEAIEVAGKPLLSPLAARGVLFALGDRPGADRFHLLLEADGLVEAGTAAVVAEERHLVAGRVDEGASSDGRVSVVVGVGVAAGLGAGERG